MKTSRLVTFGALFSLVLASAPAFAAADGWGASFSFGPSTSRIIHARTTLVPGRFPPMSKVGPLFIWPGMSNSKGDLIQTTLDAYSDNTWCGASATQWCAEASVFGSFGQRNGPAVAIDADDHVTIDYKLESDGNTWTQTVTSLKLGKVVSTLQSASGPMPGTGFGFATEADADSFTIDTQYYLCTEFHFAEADPKFGSTGVGATGARYGATGTGSGPGTAKNLRTPDGGLTWLVDLITLPAMQPQGTQTPAPAINCNTGGGGSGTGGASSTGGAASGGARPTTGGTTSAGGATSAGGKSAAGGARSGGAPGAGRTPGAGGMQAATGGQPSGGAGGKSTNGGSSASGGAVASAGALGAGGASAAGGALGAGGSSSTGSGGAVGNGGSSASGGASTSTNAGGKAGSVSTGGSGPSAGRSSGGSSGGADNGSGCSCSFPGKNEPRGALALVVGAALALRRRRRRG